MDKIGVPDRNRCDRNLSARPFHDPGKQAERERSVDDFMEIGRAETRTVHSSSKKQMI